MIARAASQLLGKLSKLSMDAHACRERIPGTHTFTGGTVVGVKSHVDSALVRTQRGRRRVIHYQPNAIENCDKSVYRVDSSLSAVSLVLSSSACTHLTRKAVVRAVQAEFTVLRNVHADSTRDRCARAAITRSNPYCGRRRRLAPHVAWRGRVPVRLWEARRVPSSDVPCRARIGRRCVAPDALSVI